MPSETVKQTLKKLFFLLALSLIITLIYTWSMTTIKYTEMETTSWTEQEGTAQVYTQDVLKATVIRVLGNSDTFREIHDYIIFTIFFVPLLVGFRKGLANTFKYAKVKVVRVVSL